jgi:hypothetical protein
VPTSTRSIELGAGGEAHLAAGYRKLPAMSGALTT